MRHQQGDADKLRKKFWVELADSPLLFLQLDGDPKSAVPMHIHLDKDANSAVWFYTDNDNHFTKGGPATATMASKDHDIFTRFHGTLTRETDPGRFDKHWTNHVEAWFSAGKASATMLRMDLGAAEIWDHNLGLLTTARMALGHDVRAEGQEHHAETTL